MIIKIADFVKGRNTTSDAVNAWIRRHEEVQKDCTMIGKDRAIDTESQGYQELNRVYPLYTEISTSDPKDKQTIADLQRQLIETQSKLEQAQKALMAFKDHENEQKLLQQDIDNQKLLTAQVSKERDELKEKNAKLEDEKYQADLGAAKMEGQLTEISKSFEREKAEKEALREELDSVYSRSFWQRVANKRISHK